MEGTGLVLAGGGGKGIYQVGMIKVLAEAGYLDDVVAISGSSIGGVNGVLFAEGIAEKDMKYTCEQMEQVWDEIDYNVFFNMDAENPVIGDSHFSRGATQELIDKYLDYKLFEGENALPVYCTVARCPEDINSYEKISSEEFKLISSASPEETYARYTEEYICVNKKSMEEISNILLATSALPVIYSPVKINDGLYVDGGLKDNVPIKPLYDLGIRRFIVIELTTHSAIKNPENYADAEIIDILPSRDLGKLIEGTMNFDKTDKAFKKHLGELDGKRYIKTLFEKDEDYIAVQGVLEELDYKQAVDKKEFDRKYEELSSSVNSSLDYLKNIEAQFGDFKL